MKRIPELTKKLILPTTFSNSSSVSTPESLTTSKYATAIERPKANSCSGVAPTSTR